MTTNLNISGSPFDNIRHITPEGREYWSARDLMPLLGYERWERFADAIDRAKISAANAGYDIATNFPGAAKITQTKPAADFHLSRYACYLVALNGDPRKPEIAAAQTYFVIRTREAETAKVDHQIPKTLPDALRAYAREVEAREAAESYARELEPKAEYVDKFVSADDCILFRAVANQLDVQEKVLRELLVEKRWIYRVFIGSRFSRKAGALVEEYEWRAYADKKHFFRLISQHNAPRHHNNQLRQTLYVTPPGEQAIQVLVAKTMEQQSTTAAIAS